MIVLDVLADMNSVFDALFFGNGSWLGLLIIIMFAVGLTFAYKYVGLLMLPVTFFLAINYFSEALGWHGLIMILTSIFVIIHVAIEGRK